MATTNAPRPGRALAVTGLVLLALYGGLFAGKSKAPQLGLDLRGGTTVILQPVGVKSGKVSKDSLAKAVDIIRQRVNGLGVAEADVTTQAGRNIVISVPGKGRDQVVKLVGQTAQLRFREVLQQQAVTATPTPSGSPNPSGSPSPTPKVGGSAGATPKPTPSATSNGRALSRALQAAATPTPASTPAPAPSGSAAPAAPTPTPSSSAAPPAANAADAARLYATATCAQLLALNAGAPDDPKRELVACDQANTTKYLLAPAQVVGTDVRTASANLDQTSGTQWQVNVKFTGSGQSKFTNLTKVTTGKQVAIVLDARVISAPTIQGTIPGDAQITGSFSQKESSDLANVLKYGALPLTFRTQSAETISPTLGDDQLHAGLLAGAIGIGLVVLYSLLYYRGLGLVTIASLALSGLVIYASTVLLGRVIGYTLSLAGIAGFIVAVGITADSFVVFFERLRDEVREGRTLRSAVERAWVRARRTIISADMVSILAAAILYLLSVGSVRGFAFTLGLSTIVDLFVVFLFTKPLIAVLARTRLYGGGGAFSGLGSDRMGLDAASEPALRARRTKPKEA